MTARVKKIAEQVMALPQDEREEFLSWLADFEAGDSDDWDKDIARDSQPGGRLEGVLERVRKCGWQMVQSAKLRYTGLKRTE